jgi:hypothetical protein
MNIDLSKLVPISELAGEDAEESEQLKGLANCARDFIKSFDWCLEVREIHAGIAVAEVVGVFLITLVPARPDIDQHLWVIVGDIPPAYLVIDQAPTPVDALLLYTDLMQEWVNAVKAGQTITELIPVNVTPTEVSAKMLESRLRYLVERIVPVYREA